MEILGPALSWKKKKKPKNKPVPDRQQKHPEIFPVVRIFTLAVVSLWSGLVRKLA